MQKPLFILVIILCSACSQLPFTPIPDAPVPHAQAVVFDIDGTLTPRVWSVFTPREDAARAVSLFADKGYAIFYVSTRVGWLSAGVPDWLDKHGFPPGSVHIAQTCEERDDPDGYKTGVLKALVAQGWTLSYAYGDSSTDLTAYASAGIPQARVFALRRKGEDECLPGPAAACLKGWTEHLEFVTGSVGPAQ